MGFRMYRRQGKYVVAVVCLLQCLLGANGRVDDAINMARCRVHCLTLLQQGARHQAPLVMSHTGSAVSMVACLEDANCTACVKPCNQPFANLASCHKICEHESSVTCHHSCQYMKFVYEAAQDCPWTSHGCQQHNDSVSTCEHHANCSAGATRCCPSSCGRMTCVSAARSEELPEIADAPTVFEKSRGQSIEVRWNHVHNNKSEPLLYVIDQRYSIGKHYNEDEVSDWQSVMQTTHNLVRLRDVFPGYWYELRVTTVNVHGSRQPGPTSKPFRLKREPEPPNAPENVTEGDIEVNGQEISATVHWLPAKSDLPITRYKIFWSKRLKSPAALLTSPRENRRLIPGDQLKFVIPELEHDSSYLVQIQAICQYGDVRLKSEKTSLYLDTFTLPLSDMQANPTPMYRIHRPRPTPSALQSLTVHTPYYEDGNLKANISWAEATSVKKVLVYWSPEVCIWGGSVEDTVSRTHFGSTEEGGSFVIYDLHFDCRYVVRVQPVSSSGLNGPISHISFPTLSCREIPVKSGPDPDCPVHTPKVPDEPINFQHTFLISNADITARISWEAPGPSESPVTGYRLVWGKAIDTHISAMDVATALTKVLSRNDHVHVLRGLQEDTTYIVRVQAMSKTGAGRISSMEFTTPILQIQVTPIGPPQLPPGSKRTTTVRMYVPDIRVDEMRLQRQTQSAVFDFHSSAAYTVPVTMHTLLTVCVLLIIS